jgi:hypothetical protein
MVSTTKTATVLNLTGTEMFIMQPDGSLVYLPSSGAATASRYVEERSVFDRGDFRCYLGHTAYTKPSGLPDAQPGTFIIVTRIVVFAARSHHRDTWDLLVPDDIAPPVVDAAGSFVSCYRRLILP